LRRGSRLGHSNDELPWPRKLPHVWRLSPKTICEEPVIRSAKCEVRKQSRARILNPSDPDGVDPGMLLMLIWGIFVHMAFPPCASRSIWLLQCSCNCTAQLVSFINKQNGYKSLLVCWCPCLPGNLSAFHCCPKLSQLCPLSCVDA
jgi:hypothetical protein